MKKVLSVLRSALIMCSAVVVLSCDKVDDVTFGVVLTHTFHVNQIAAGDDLVYQTEGLLDAASVDSDFNKYKENIKSVAVANVTYTIQNCTTAGVTLSGGTLAYSSNRTTDPDPAIGVVDLGLGNIKAAENQETNLHFSQVAINDMSNLLKAYKQLNLYFNGTLSTTPANFDVLVKINATVTAGKL